jgi:NDP-sugar pyrophosphorylase family protein
MEGHSAMPSKAMLLAAGQGTRLRPLTEKVAKCMVPVAGRPVLEHNIEWLKKFGVTDVVINLHYLPEAVTNHFGDGSRFGVRITYSLERELLGTAGAVKNAGRFFDGPFFVWYGDNLSTCRLDRLWESHGAGGGLATIALHYREDPTQSGIVGLDGNGRVVRFLEKPRADQIFSHWVSAGTSCLSRACSTGFRPKLIRISGATYSRPCSPKGLRSTATACLKTKGCGGLTRRPIWRGCGGRWALVSQRR